MESLIYVLIYFSLVEVYGGPSTQMNRARWSHFSRSLGPTLYTTRCEFSE